MQGRIIQKHKLSILGVIRSSVLWKIYAAIGITVLSALATMAAVIWSRLPSVVSTEAFNLSTSLAVATMAATAVALGVGFLVARGVQKRLLEITQVAQSLAGGNLNARVKKKWG